MTYRPKNFEIRELVPPDVYTALGDRAWKLLDEGALRSLQAIRDAVGRIVVNDWHMGGGFTESGYREPDSATGAPASAHKQGRAFDCKPRDCTVRELYDYVLKNQKLFPLIERVENIAKTPTWFHFDTKPHPSTGIHVFMP